MCLRRCIIRNHLCEVNYADIAGLEGSQNKQSPNPAQPVDADGWFHHVVRCFEDENVPPQGSIDPRRDISAMDGELLLNDLIAVERRLERLAEERKKGAGRTKRSSTGDGAV